MDWIFEHCLTKVLKQLPHSIPQVVFYKQMNFFHVTDLCQHPEVSGDCAISEQSVEHPTPGNVTHPDLGNKNKKTKMFMLYDSKLDKYTKQWQHNYRPKNNKKYTQKHRKHQTHSYINTLNMSHFYIHNLKIILHVLLLSLPHYLRSGQHSMTPEQPTQIVHCHRDAPTAVGLPSCLHS